MSVENGPTLSSPALLIAVVGEPGTGKTTLLANLAEEQRTHGVRVEGILAIAGKRHGANHGADRYSLRFVGRAETLPWVQRNERVTPPYAFDAITERRLRGWADGLVGSDPVSLLVLDEFGRFEARGEGLMSIWPTIVSAAPRIVVMSVRSGYAEQIHERLERRFDMIVHATDPLAAGKLRQACRDFGEWTGIGLMGGIAGGIEMSAGSFLHAARVPARGLVLSSLQGMLMTFAGFGLAQPGRVIWVPFISAGLKALSPAGNRIRPMFAICMQGLLYGTAVQVTGWNAFGVTLGGMLVGAWSALQGLLLQYVLLGENLLRAYDSTVIWVAEKWNLALPGLPVLAGCWAAISALLAGGAAFAAWRLRAPPAVLQRMMERGEKPAAGPGPTAGTGSRWRDLAHWQFWLPLALVISILLAAGHSLENLTWMVLRFVAVAMLLLTILSFWQPARLADKLRRCGWWGPATAFNGALHRRRR